MHIGLLDKSFATKSARVLLVLFVDLFVSHFPAFGIELFSAPIAPALENALMSSDMGGHVFLSNRLVANHALRILEKKKAYPVSSAANLIGKLSLLTTFCRPRCMTLSCCNILALVT